MCLLFSYIFIKVLGFSQTIERYQELENESMEKIVELESAVMDTTKERDLYYVSSIPTLFTDINVALLKS